MFLLVLNDSQSKAFLTRPFFTLTSGALLSLSMFYSGVSPYFLAALLLPILEATAKFRFARHISDRLLLAIAVAALTLHAGALALAQKGAEPSAKLAVNLAYIGSILVGVGIASFLNVKEIACLDQEPETKS